VEGVLGRTAKQRGWLRVVLFNLGGFVFVFPDRSLEDAGGRFVEGKRAFSPNNHILRATYSGYLRVCLPLGPAVPARLWDCVPGKRQAGERRAVAGHGVDVGKRSIF